MARTPYPQYERPSGWNALLPPADPPVELAGEVTADAVIIGAGYTGVAAARRWARERPEDDIIVLDASRIGEGNPGRNSGFLLEISLANDADPDQLARMHACNELIARTMHRIRDDVFDRGIQCDIERAGTYRAAAGDVGGNALDAYRRFLDAASLPYEHLSRADLEQRLGTAYYREGLYSPDCYLVQPAALIRGLVRWLPDSVTVHEESPALNLQRDGAGWLVRTPGGVVRAPVVFVANNAFAKTLGIAPARVTAMYTYAGLTEPLPDDEVGGMEQSWGLLPTHRLGCTLRRTRDNRLLIRSHYGYEREESNERIGERLLESLRQRFPSLSVTGFASIWGGATGFTLNGAPVWGEQRPGLFASVGCNGGGVVKGTLFGELLANLAMGREVPDMKALFGTASWMPPEPIRRLGFEVISRIERRQGVEEM